MLAGDVAYEKDMAEAATDWLAALRRRGATVLIGDPRRTYLALDRLESVDRIPRAGDARTRGFGDQADGRVSVSVKRAAVGDHDGSGSAQTRPGCLKSDNE